MAHVLANLRIVPKQECGEASALAKELGLELQARRYEKPLAEEVFTALTADEVTLWAHHCPTHYFQPPVAQGNRALEAYGFDSVPVEVMRHWKAIKDNYAFDSFQIWTTERTPRTSDPLLIGWIGTKAFLLARWGLESPDAMSLKEIAKSLYDNLIDDCLMLDYPFQSAESKRRSAILRARRTYIRFGAAERYLGLAA